MTNKQKTDVLFAWNEVEETITSLNELSDVELINNREALRERLNIALELLGNYVTENDVADLL